MLRIQIKVDDTPTYYNFLETDSAIEGVALNRALNSDVASLVAEVECGEVNIEFSNLFGEFNPQDENAPYKDLKNGLEVKVFNVVEEIDTTIFTGYIVDFAAPTSSETQSCTVRAVDKLQMLLNADLRSIDLQVEKGITLAEYFSAIFEAYGLTSEEYEIDEDLMEVTLNYSLVVGKKLSEQFYEICKAVDCYIYCNRVGRIVVRTTAITGIPVKTYTRQDQENYLVNTEYGYSLFNSYNSLKVGYVAAQLSEVKEILKLEQQEIPAGESTLENLELGIANLYELDTLKITSSANVRAINVSATSSTITITLNNPSHETTTISLIVYGKTIETTNAFITRTLNSELNQSLEVSSILLQDKASAEQLAERLYNRTRIEMPFIKADIEFIDFPIDLGYIVRIVDSDVGLTYEGYVHSIDLEYDGGGYSIVSLGIKALYEEEEANE